MSTEPRRPGVISLPWMQGMLFTFACFAAPGSLTIRVSEDHALVPGRVVSEQRNVARGAGDWPDAGPDGTDAQ